MLLLGAVYNRFRMEEPVKKGLSARPTGDSRENKQPVGTINQDKAETKKGPAPGQSSAS